MSNPKWSTLTLNIDPFGSLKPPLRTILKFLEALEALLEKLLALIKAFMLDLVNPLRAIIALLLAAIRAIINQLKTTGLSFLVVRPNFGLTDFRAVINSVSGAYPSFESKVYAKFFDDADIFRPQYPSGMYTSMLVLYIGADSPGDLFAELFALLELLKHPAEDLVLPAPINLTARPVNKSGDAIAQFRRLFDSDLNQAVVLEWQMPNGTSGLSSPTLIGQITSALPSFTFPKFLIERTTEDEPRGAVVRKELDTATLGPRTANVVNNYNIPSVKTNVSVRESDGSVYRHFGYYTRVTDLSYLGALSGTYRYVDEDPNLEPGKSYYYRVRAYFGDITKYVNFALNSPDAMTNAGLIRQDTTRSRWVVNFGPGVKMGKPSTVVRGFVPRKRPDTEAFSPYSDLYNAVLVGLLLNMECPPAREGDSDVRMDQKAGWGVLSVIAGPAGFVKDGLPSATEFKDNFITGTFIRRLVNSILELLYYKPAVQDRLAQQWKEGVQATVTYVMDIVGVTYDWQLFPIVGDVTDGTYADIDAYLASATELPQVEPALGSLDTDEFSDFDGSQPSPTAGLTRFPGPLPLSFNDPATGGPREEIDADSRRELAQFLRTALSLIPTYTGHLRWYSVTLGDLFPSIMPFLFDFEQWILSLLKAIESALQEIKNIIENLLQRIRDLEQILRAILALLDLLSIDVRVSVLGVAQTGSATDLAETILNSEDKPGDSPYGLHSGIVMTAGAPGPGLTSALEALGFILTLPF